jgi:excisionase family DNA binding protein
MALPKAAPHPVEPLYTVEEVADRLNVSIRTVQRRIKDKTCRSSALAGSCAFGLRSSLL